MSYSFTEPLAIYDNNDEVLSDSESTDTPQSFPIMVPVADILNHIANNNAHLDFGIESLKVVATKDILSVSRL